MTCPKCGAERPAGAVECPQCGVIYARFEAAEAKKREAEAEERRRAAIAEMYEADAKKAAPLEPPKSTEPKLVDCPACGKQVSIMADACPHCGHPVDKKLREKPPVKNNWLVTIPLGILMLLPVWGLFHCAEKVGEKLAGSSGETASTTSASGTITIGANTMGCRSVEDFRKLADIAASHDYEAFNKQMINYTAAGRCNILPAGATAYQEDASFRHGAVKVRVKGETESWWINAR